jgi:ABC-2 type transport system permease protein
VLFWFSKPFSKDLQTQRGPNTGLTDATDQYLLLISNYINAILQNYMQEVNQTDQAAYQIRRQTQFIYNSELKSVFTFVQA